MDEITQEKAPSKKGLYIGIAVVVALILVWFLFRSSLWMMGGIANSTVDGVDIDRNADGSVTYTNEEGTATVGSTEVPDDWPSDAPVYTNGTIQTTVSTNQQTGQNGSVIALVTSDSAQDVATFYQQKLAAEGWAVEQTAVMGTNMVVTAKKEDRTFAAYIADAGNGQVSVTLGVTAAKE